MSGFSPIEVQLSTPLGSFTVPVTPEEIQFDAGGGFATYKIIDLGEVLRQRGRQARRVQWSSFFPGPGLAQQSTARWMSRSAVLNPEFYVVPILGTQEMGEDGECQLVIAGAHYASMKCFVERFTSKQKGAWGNVEYTLQLVESRELRTTVQPVALSPIPPAAVQSVAVDTPLPDLPRGDPSADATVIDSTVYPAGTTLASTGGLKRPGGAE